MAAEEAKGDAVLPPLPYGYDALEPHIDEATMRVHHDGHHAGYTKKVNACLADMRAAGHGAIADRGIPDLIANLGDIPEAFRQRFCNTAGGYVNHCFFWKCMTDKDAHKPTGALAAAIDETFGSYDEFKAAFSKCAGTVFGSGWAWLYLDKSQSPAKLVIGPSFNQDTPANDSNKVPLLTLDVWEHAYYLKYNKNRPAYIEAFWNVVGWEEAAAIFEANK